MPSPVSDLSRIPVRQRRLLALGLLPSAVLLLVAGVLVGILGAGIAVHLGGAVLALLGLFLAGVALGIQRTVAADIHEASVDEAIRATVGPCGSDCSNETGEGACATDCAVKTLPRL